MTGAVVAMLLLMAAAWTAAGSLGLMGDPLRRTVTWLLAGGAAVLVGVRVNWTLQRVALTIVTVGVVAAAVGFVEPAGAVLGVALAGAALSELSTGTDRRLLRAAAFGLVGFALYRFLLDSNPAFWLATDRAGRLLGDVGAFLGGRPLWVGATFAGVDFIVVSALTLAGLLAFTILSAHRAALLWVAGATLLAAVHLGYLVVVDYADVIEAEAVRLTASRAWWTFGLLEYDPEAFPLQYPSAVYRIVHTIRRAVPWNLPLLGALGHLATWGVVLAACRPWRLPADTKTPHEVAPPPVAVRRRWAALRLGLIATGVLLGLLLPVVSLWTFRRPSLEGKTVVAWEKGFLNWERPKHGEYGRLTIGMYGNFGRFVESLGGTFVRSPELSEADIDRADILVLFFPDDPREPEQRERIERFVRDGGRLVVLGEHTIYEPIEDEPGSTLDNRFNEVLAPTDMRVRFDSSQFAVGGWLESYHTVGHPATVGIADDRNQFGVVIGASVETRWPAWPVLIGRWGWNDPGDIANTDRAMMGDDRYAPGEKLGDVVLAAEQPLDDGRVIAFGDTSSFTNGIMVGSHDFVGRLLADAAEGPPPRERVFRMMMSIILAGVLSIVFGFRFDGLRAALTVAAMVAATAVAASMTHRNMTVLPDGRPDDSQGVNRLAYIDSTHLEAAAGESWRPEGTMGLAMTLMRSGYLALDLPEMTPERLERAGLVVSVAPARPFTRDEIAMVEAFVRGGGTFILTVGYPEAGPSRELLHNFGFDIGEDLFGSPALVEGNPSWRRFFKTPYLNTGHYVLYVRFHTAWPLLNVEYADGGWPELNERGRFEDDKFIVYVWGNNTHPLIAARKMGDGQFVVIGDTAFAMNKNLEDEYGRPFDGLYENAHFWRYFLTVLNDEPPWIPPAPEPVQ